MSQATPAHVVIAGGGVAALETLLALRDLARGRVDITLVAPQASFTYRPMTVAEPFAKGHATSYELAGIAKRFGARLVQDTVAEVAPAEQAVRTGEGTVIKYDHLVLATGARATPAYAHAITFGEDREEEALHGLLRDAEEGYAKRIAFVVPNEPTWTLPLYELALMTAREAWSMGADWLEFLFLTPESRPLAIFGATAGDTVTELLDGAGIEFVGSAYTTVEHGHLVVDPGGRRIDVNRVVSLPRLEGLQIPGVPVDAAGFVPVDTHGRVAGLSQVYAAGDGTAFPIKQGGLATQQADAVAETIAEAVGAPIVAEPFRPVLRGMLLTGGDDRFMRNAIAGGEGEAKVANHALWWPPSKIAGRYLAPFLFGRDELAAVERIRGEHLAVETPLGPSGVPADAS
ncbi:MAG: sulfide:quinone oxidoreductase [Solirubrobacteraceae bacterium]|jgi:sulfide:quinone oxidoreductase|nr:sulfide:quinone oxidoreductase [Solirubrobacteraceae bacterium]